MANTIFEAMPGTQMPVADVMNSILLMSRGQSIGGKETENLFRASQMNLILHFGFCATVEKAQQEFNTALKFAQKYPCRVIVMCPEEAPADSNHPLKAKLFSECYLGKEFRSTCCCEVLTLGYTPSQTDFLENQVSIWLEGDLPTHYWLTGVDIDSIQTKYFKFINNTCRKLIYDSAIDNKDIDKLHWKNAIQLRDLSFARTLPYRQSIGQYLSGFSPVILATNLKSIEITYQPELEAETQQLAAWLDKCIRNCSENNSKAEMLLKSEKANNCEHCLKIEINYNNNKYFHWNYCNMKKMGTIKSNLGSDEVEFSIKLNTSREEEALADSIFY